MGCIGLKAYNAYIYRKPGDGKYIQSINFVSAFTQSGLLQKYPDACIEADVNKGSGGRYICPLFKYTDDPTRAVTDLKFLSGVFNHDPTPPGYTKIPQDLNEGHGGRWIYIAYSKNGTQKITDISFFIKHCFSTSPQQVPGWKILMDADGDVANLNWGVKDAPRSNLIYKTE